VRAFTSSVLEPGERGVEFGEHHTAEIIRTVAAYRRLFAARASRPFPVDAWAERAWDVIREQAPTYAPEIRGIADGAGVPVREIAMLNARTELLGVADPLGDVEECSTVVALPDGGSPVAVQTWDWYDAMADDWLVWTIPHPDGHVVRTVTEYGILGKIGVSSHGVGVLFNMLRHRNDTLAEERGVGFPVHLLSRQILDTARSVEEAVAVVSTVRTSASTSLTIVDAATTASVELFPDGPGVLAPEDGLLVRTNHFVSDAGRPGCLASTIGPGSELRRTTLLKALDGRVPQSSEAVVDAMHDHAEVGGVCAHPDRSLDPVLQHATLATVSLDVTARDLHVTPGGPCARPREGGG